MAGTDSHLGDKPLGTPVRGMLQVTLGGRLSPHRGVIFPQAEKQEWVKTKEAQNQHWSLSGS